LLHGDLQDRSAGLNFVPVLEIGHRNPLAIDEGAVAAAHVHESALRWIQFDQEVNPGEESILRGKAKMGPRRAPDKKGVVTDEREGPALVGACCHA
jgi:hypothetical protein